VSKSKFFSDSAKLSEPDTQHSELSFDSVTLNGQNQYKLRFKDHSHISVNALNLLYGEIDLTRLKPQNDKQRFIWELQRTTGSRVLVDFV
jgi:hypothetical protein